MRNAFESARFLRTESTGSQDTPIFTCELKSVKDVKMMESLHRLAPHLIQALLVLIQGLGAGFLASSAVSYFLYQDSRHDTVRRTNIPIVHTNEKPRLQADYKALLYRNMFCASCDPIVVEEEPQSAGVEGSSNSVKATLEGATLVTTMVASNPKDSLATLVLTDPSDAKFVILSEGDSFGDAQVVAIEMKRVVFIQNEQEKVLELMTESKVNSPMIATTTPPPGMSPQKGDDQIRQVGPNKYEVDRSVITDFMKNMATASSGARVMPDPNGGFRVTFVRSFSIFYKLGIRSGDVITSVNNIQLDSIDQTFALYTKLKDANHLTVSVNRGGQTINMDYSIR